LTLRLVTLYNSSQRKNFHIDNYMLLSREVEGLGPMKPGNLHVRFQAA
jgi:hypothetical protein